MTTIKQYKAMMEGATEGPYDIKTTSEAFVSCMVASYHIAPELIRVMELMGEALKSALSMAQSECWPVEEMEIDKALSEYRKLRGE